MRAVQRTRELDRVLSIPRRTLDDGEGAEEFARALTALLRTPYGEQTLRPIQALALEELCSARGLFASLRVGAGKTLISLLAALVCEARRPMLLLPAALIDKTRREQRILAQHWPIPEWIRFYSYELLGRPQSHRDLETYEPDMIIADECHKLKNPRAAVTKRVARYMQARPSTMFVALSGTMTKRSLRDYAHLLLWSLPPLGAPIPMSWSELQDWADALDAKKDDAPPTCNVGALRALCNESERAQLDFSVTPEIIVRRAYRRRLLDTTGVVMTSDRYLGSSLRIGSLTATPSNATRDAFAKLRAEWTTPDEWPISDPMTLRRHAREIALGFYYVWDPRPPQPWIDARKSWASACRYILTNNRRDLDSEKQVVQAVDGGHYPEVSTFLRAWRDVKDAFTPNTHAVWLDSAALDAATLWGRDGGIVWCEHLAFARELSRRTGWPYFGARGEDERGNSIEVTTERTIIASIEANKQGRNLQRYSRSLVMSPPSNGLAYEQLFGRLHREGQEADEVLFDLFVTCREHVRGIDQAFADARYQQDSTGQEQKLLFADLTIDLDDFRHRVGPAWEF